MNNNEKNHEKWMSIALREAENAYKLNEVPIGAVIIKEEYIIGKGYNLCQKLNDPTAHAEIIAITSAANYLGDWRLQGCRIYVTKEPCAMCAGAIMNARLEFTGFGMYDDSEGCCDSLYQLCSDKRFKHNLPVKGGILEIECKKLVKQFFINCRK